MIKFKTMDFLPSEILVNICDFMRTEDRIQLRSVNSLIRSKIPKPIKKIIKKDLFQEYYVNERNEIDGMFFEFEFGTKVKEIFYAKGFKNGIYKEFNIDGIEKQCEYKRNKRHGKFIKIDHNNILHWKTVSHYTDGKWHGSHTVFSKRGNMIYNSIYDMGRLVYVENNVNCKYIVSDSAYNKMKFFQQKF